MRYRNALRRLGALASLTLVLAIMALPMAAMAEKLPQGEMMTVNGLSYVIDEDEHGNPFAMLTGGEAGVTEIKVRAELGDEEDPIPVRRIMDKAFSGDTEIKSVSLPVYMTEIGEGAFEGCTSLEEALIWGDVTSWGKACFKGGTALTEVSISSSTNRIGDAAFQGCTALEDVFFWGCKTIGASAFQGCTALTDIDIPSETTSIGSKAFEGCANLERVTIWPDDDEITIAPDAFANCPKLDEIP